MRISPSTDSAKLLPHWALAKEKENREKTGSEAKGFPCIVNFKDFGIP